jgi:hypothetical protein
MKGLQVNIDVMISHVLQRMNGSLSWRTIALMVNGGADRVQSTSAYRVAKYAMSSFGIKIYINKLQSTINKRKKQCCKWSKRFPIFWKAIGG